MGTNSTFGRTISSDLWRETLVDKAGSDVSLAALTSARLIRAEENAPTLNETRVQVERFFHLESDQGAAVMTALAAETKLAEAVERAAERQPAA